jgi:uncharacterized protein with HEPN domain
MTNEPLRIDDYFGHIVGAIDRIQKYSADCDEASFLSAELIQDAVIRNFEVIGEASKNIERIAPGFMAANPQLPLAFAYEMRNVLAHGYYKVDLALVWRTIDRELPYLKEQVLLVAKPLPNIKKDSRRR